MKKILTIIVLFTAGCLFDKEPEGLPPSELPKFKPLPPKFILPNREYDLLYKKQRIAEKQIVIPKDKEFCSEKG